MIDCGSDVFAYHDEKVRLSPSEMKAMKARQKSTRQRLISGLAEKGLPKPLDIEVQGSFAMKTMVQDDDNDYDVDEGAYFDIQDLTTTGGVHMTPQQARKMVRNAVSDEQFIKECEARQKCVRVYYRQGCHIDIPVYRCLRDLSGQIVNEIALGDDWVESDARHVTKWFKDQNISKSPNTANGGQMRRIVQLIKKFTKSRKGWSNNMLSGFGITVLVEECYVRNDHNRDDIALIGTILNIISRLNADHVIRHPVMGNVIIDDGSGGAKTQFFRVNLSNSILGLIPLIQGNCLSSDAPALWDAFFNTDFFRNRGARNSVAKRITAALSPSAVTAESLISASNASPGAVLKDGGGRYG